MNSREKKNWVPIGTVLILVFPFIVLLIVLLTLKINIFDNPEFWYGYMAYFGSVVLAGVALYQSEKSTILSLKFDKMNANQNYSFAQLVFPANVYANQHKDTMISYANKDDEKDHPIVIIEEQSNNEIVMNKEYVFDLTFKDHSKAVIKKFCLDVQQATCIQDPSKKGLMWSDGSKDKIQVGFKSTPFGESAFPQWTSDNEFKIRIIIYAPQNGLFFSMMECEERCCLVLPVKLISVCGIVTEMKYRCWIEKDESDFAVCRIDSRLINVREEAEHNAD